MRVSKPFYTPCRRWAVQFEPLDGLFFIPKLTHIFTHNTKIIVITSEHEKAGNP